MANSRSGRLSLRDVAIIWLGLAAGYALVVGVRRSVPADLVFAATAYVTSSRPRAWPAGVIPIVLIPLGVLSPELALASVALLVLGPFVILMLIAGVEIALKLRRSSTPGIDRIAAVRVIVGPLRWVAVAVFAASALAELGVVGLVVVGLPGALLWRGLVIPSCFLAVGGSALTGWSITPLALAGLSILVAAWRWRARPPKLWHPLPAPSPRDGPASWLRARRCDRRIRSGDLIGARAIMRSARRASFGDCVRLAFLDVEERSYQTVLSLSSTTEETSSAGTRLYLPLLRARALSGIAQFGAARALYRRLLDEQSERHPFDVYVRVLMAENDLAAGEISGARSHAGEAQARTRIGRDYFLRLRASCVLAECAIYDKSDPVGLATRLQTVNNDMLANRRVVQMAIGSDQAKLVRQLFGRSGSLHQYFVRVDTLQRRGDRLDDATGWDPDAVAMAMAVAGWSDDLVELLLTEARRAAAAGKQGMRMLLGARALMELDGT